MKAQVTFFIILGFVVLLAIGITITMLTTRTEQRIEHQQATTAKIPLRVQPIKDDITNCLKLVTQEALIKLGKQGAYLYRAQGGIVEDTPTSEIGVSYLEFDGTPVRYLLQAPKANIPPIFFIQPPAYPWELFPYAQEGSSVQHFIGYYGHNELPSLYRPAPTSIQEQLEGYINNKLSACVPFTKYPGTSITAGTVNTSIYIANTTLILPTEEAISITLNWPITISEPQQNTTTTLTNFATSLPVPLAKIYYTLQSIINNDGKNISYEPITQHNYLIAITPFEKDSIVTVTFPGITLGDKPYEFRFVRKSRHPALHVVKELKTTFSIPNVANFKDTIQLPTTAKIRLGGTQLYFSDYTCGTTNTAATWNIPVIPLFASDPDGAINNQNLQFKLKPEEPKLEHPTGTGQPTQIDILVSKKDNPTKKDTQTFYVHIYACAGVV